MDLEALPMVRQSVRLGLETIERFGLEG